MTDDLGSIPGCAFVVLICGWAVWFLGRQLRQNIASGTAVDSTLSEVDKDDAPGMFGLQVVGFVLLIGAAAIIGVGAIVVLIQVVWVDFQVMAYNADAIERQSEQRTPVTQPFWGVGLSLPGWPESGREQF